MNRVTSITRKSSIAIIQPGQIGDSALLENFEHEHTKSRPGVLSILHYHVFSILLEIFASKNEHLSDKRKD